MPKVPSYDNFTVMPGGPSDARVADPISLEAAAAPGKQMQQFGAAVQNFGEHLGAQVLDAQKEANALRVADARNQAKELEYKLKYDKDTGYSNLTGIDALQRPDGIPLADEYAAKYKAGLSAITDSLGNDAQKREFSAIAANALTEFHGSAMQHEGAQFREYGLSVHQGTVQNAINDIGLNYNNPEVINKNLDAIQAATYQAAKMQGKSAVWAEAQARDMMSKAHTVAIETALEKNDPQYADAYLKRYAKSMQADDILKVNSKLTKELDAHIAMNAVSNVMQSQAANIVTPESDRAFNIAVGTESGGQQFDSNGAPLTSPKGAIGIAQVMPTTGPEAAQLAGLPWDETKFKTDANYNRALGKAYFEKQLKDFGGSLPLAYAAYNAGPGATREALKAAQDGKSNWLDHLPAETQNYVAKNMAAYSAGEGNNRKPTLMEVHQAVREQVGTESPTRLKMALDEATRQYEDVNKAIKQRDDEATANAMRAVLQNGGRFSDLPVNIRSSIPVGDVDKVMDFSKKVAKGDDTTSLWLYNKLESNPKELASLSDNEFYKLRAELSESDFKHFSDLRAKQMTGEVKNAPSDLNTQAIKQTLDDRLRMMSIDPTPKDGSSDAVRVGAIRKFVNESVLMAQANSGKKMSDAEVSQHIDALFAKNTIYDRWYGDKSGPMLGMTASDIPGNIGTALKAAFKKRGVDSPTDADLLNAYWRQLTVVPNGR